MDGVSICSFFCFFCFLQTLTKKNPKRFFDAFAETLKRGVDRGELIIAKNTIELTSEGMFWANTIGAEMAVECLYNGKENLVSLEESTAKIAKTIMLNKLRLRSKRRN